MSSLLRLLLFGLLLPSLFSLPCGQLSAKPKGSKSEIEYWTSLMEDKKEEFQSLKDQVNLFETLVQEATESFKETLGKDRIRFHQTNYLLSSNTKNPYEFRLVSGELDKQTAEFKATMSNMEEMLQSIKLNIDIARKAKTELDALKELEPPQEVMKEVDESLVFIDRFLNRFGQLEKSVEEAIEPGRRHLAERNANFASLDSQIYRHLEFNFLSSRGSLLESESWLFMAPVLMHWLKTLPLLVCHKIPDTFKEWFCFFVIAALMTAVFMAALCFGFRRWLDRARERSPDAARLIKMSFMAFSGAAALFCGAVVLDLPENVIFYRVAIILVAAAGLELGWSLRLLFFDVSRPASPLLPLFYVYASGSVLQLLDAPQLILSVIWPPCMLLLAIRMLKLMKEEGMMAFQRNIGRSTVVLAAAFALMAFLGFSHMAIFLSMVWFMLAVSFQFGSAFSLLLRRFVEAKSGLGGLARSLILGFAVPSAWLLIISASLFWMTNQVVDIKLFFKAVTYDMRLFGDISFSVLDLIVSVFLFFVVRTALKALCSTMDKSCSEAGEKPSVLGPFKSLISTLAWVLYALLILHIFDVSLSHLGVILGGLSVGIGFGMQHFVSNLVSGLILIFGRDIREGDIIEMGGVWAKIEKISMRSTLACTVENAMISIPNSTLLNSQVTNWTLNNKHIRRDIKIVLAFGSDIELARQILMRTAAALPDVMKLPQPEVFLSSVGPVSTELTLRIWIIDIEKAHKVLSDINKSIDQAFDENRSKVAFPGNAGALAPKQRPA